MTKSSINPHVFLRLRVNLAIIAVAIISASMSACGRPATEAECREILRRTAELELSDRLSDRQLIEDELRNIEDSMEAPMMEKCVGKRITEDAMACVRGAKTSQELSRECFR